jgi:hypothetical protein
MIRVLRHLGEEAVRMRNAEFGMGNKKKSGKLRAESREFG